jgi:hypothetical protein
MMLANTLLLIFTSFSYDIASASASGGVGTRASASVGGRGGGRLAALLGL